MSFAVFQCPSANNQKTVDGGAHYCVIVGDETLFGTDGTGRSSNDYKRNMLLIVERQEAICWMTPNQEISQAAAEIGINKTATTFGSFHTGGTNAATKAGGVQFISVTIPDEKLREWIVGTDDEIP